jgi:hypothetical protein
MTSPDGAGEPVPETKHEEKKTEPPSQPQPQRVLDAKAAPPTQQLVEATVSGAIASYRRLSNVARVCVFVSLVLFGYYCYTVRTEIKDAEHEHFQFREVETIQMPETCSNLSTPYYPYLMGDINRPSCQQAYVRLHQRVSDALEAWTMDFTVLATKDAEERMIESMDIGSELWQIPWIRGRVEACLEDIKYWEGNLTAETAARSAWMIEMAECADAASEASRARKRIALAEPKRERLLYVQYHTLRDVFGDSGAMCITILIACVQVLLIMWCLTPIWDLVRSMLCSSPTKEKTE